MSTAAAAPLSLEIIEGPGAGLRVPLRGSIVIGGGEDADLVLDNPHTAPRHARVSLASRRSESRAGIPADTGGSPASLAETDFHAIVEDLGSGTGTFVNHVEVNGRALFAPGDELQVGLTVFALRTAAEVDRQVTGVRAIPAPLASPPGSPASEAPLASPSLLAAPQGPPVLAAPQSPPVLAAPQSPPVLAAAQSPPRYISAAALDRPDRSRGAPEMADLERLLDANVRFSARTAPLAILVLVALIVAIYLGAR